MRALRQLVSPSKQLRTAIDEQDVGLLANQTPSILNILSIDVEYTPFEAEATGKRTSLDRIVKMGESEATCSHNVQASRFSFNPVLSCPSMLNTRP